jgi:Lrp/AsnC family leucine-responsive transcriptional regulator
MPETEASHKESRDTHRGTPVRGISAEIDDTDVLILDMLESDGRATLAELAGASGLSVSAVQTRVQKLERRGVIKGYRAVIDQERRGRPISAFVSVTPLDYSQESDIPRRLEKVGGVVSCHSIAGAPSFMLLVRVGSPSELEELLNLIHRVVPVSTETTVILQTYFEK